MKRGRKGIYLLTIDVNLYYRCHYDKRNIQFGDEMKEGKGHVLTDHRCQSLLSLSLSDKRNIQFDGKVERERKGMYLLTIDVNLYYRCHCDEWNIHFNEKVKQR